MLRLLSPGTTRLSFALTSTNPIGRTAPITGLYLLSRSSESIKYPVQQPNNQASERNPDHEIKDDNL